MNLELAYKKWFAFTNGTVAYEQPYNSFLPIVRKHLTGKKHILDAACGFKNRYLETLVAENSIPLDGLAGIDIDPIVKDKNRLHHTIYVQDIHNPFPVSGFEAAISLYTWEHLCLPTVALKNFRDALIPGGKLIIIGAQRYCLASTLERMMPKFVKDLIWRVFQGKPAMPYPTFACCCTSGSLTKAARHSKFRMLHYSTMDPPPRWFKKVPPVYFIMCLFSALLNRVPWFRGVRGTFLAVMEKDN